MYLHQVKIWTCLNLILCENLPLDFTSALNLNWYITSKHRQHTFNRLMCTATMSDQLWSLWTSARWLIAYWFGKPTTWFLIHLNLRRLQLMCIVHWIFSMNLPIDDFFVYILSKDINAAHFLKLFDIYNTTGFWWCSFSSMKKSQDSSFLQDNAEKMHNPRKQVQ